MRGGRTAERTTSLLAGSWARGGRWLYDLLRRVGIAVTTTLLAGSWVRGGG